MIFKLWSRPVRLRCGDARQLWADAAELRAKLHALGDDERPEGAIVDTNDVLLRIWFDKGYGSKAYEADRRALSNIANDIVKDISDFLEGDLRAIFGNNIICVWLLVQRLWPVGFFRRDGNASCTRTPKAA